MSEPGMMRISLAKIRKRHERGELLHDAKAPEGPPEGEELPADFWERAQWVEPQKRRSVHLRLDADVFDFFLQQSKGKGHLTRMQNVLRAYADAHRR